MTDNAFKIPIATLEVSGKVEGMDAATFESLAKQAEQVCPVSNAVRGNVAINVVTKLAS
jgi:osmotically inducible protein OsmC